MPFDKDQLSHRIHSAALRQVDIDVFSQDHNLNPSRATDLLLTLGADGRRIKSLQSELEVDQGWCNRESAARTFFRRILG